VAYLSVEVGTLTAQLVGSLQVKNSTGEDMREAGS